MGSSTATRVPEMVVEDPASGVAVVGMRSQEPATVRVVGQVSVETVAETSWMGDILSLVDLKRQAEDGRTLDLS